MILTKFSNATPESWSALQIMSGIVSYCDWAPTGSDIASFLRADIIGVPISVEDLRGLAHAVWGFYCMRHKRAPRSLKEVCLWIGDGESLLPIVTQERLAYIIDRSEE